MEDPSYIPPHPDEFPEEYYEDHNQGDSEEAAMLFDPEIFPPNPEEVSFDKVTAGDIEDAWFSIASAALTTKLPADRASEILMQLRDAKVIYEALAIKTQPLLDSIDHALSIIGDMAFGRVEMAELGLLDKNRLAASAHGCLTRINDTEPTENPEARLASAVSAARRQRTLLCTAKLSTLITEGSAPEDLRYAYKDVVQAPPVALDEGGSNAGNTTVGDVHAEVTKLKESGISGLTLSSGFPSLDQTLTTRKGQAPGFVRSGQLVVFVAPSGSGKTSAFNTIVPAGATDAINQGHLGRTLYCHVEDDTADIFDSMGISPGRRYAQLQDRISVVKTTSREELTKSFYREILWAKRQHEHSGLPVKLYIPPVVYVDYFQALTGANDKGGEAAATATTADLLLYGFANNDPEAIKKYSGIGFEEYAGEAWPDGLEGAEVSVVVTAQLLLKGNSAQSPYDPEKDAGNWRNYVAADSSDEPSWELHSGDYPMAKLDDIRGASVITQHATTIIGLHRPRPRNNPPKGKTACGRYGTLADTRGYFTILKARFGQRQVVVPMEFNLQRNGGSKAQYIDNFGERAVESGVLKYDSELFAQSGDPIIPEREMRSEMTRVSYF